MDNSNRYARQIRFAGLGPEGQARLGGSHVLIVGAGGLGSTLAEQLCRAGVGHIRLVDADRVELVNLHRQHLYTEADVRCRRMKADVAAEHLRAINSGVRIEPVAARLDGANALELSEGMDLVLDGTDNWPTRFVLNDACVKRRLPWIFAGVVAAEAVTMNILPGQTPCLRCIYDAPPPPAASPTCLEVGVLGPAVQVVAGLAGVEALKVLAGHVEALHRKLIRLDLWGNAIQQLDLADARNADCPCCQGGRYEFLK